MIHKPCESLHFYLIDKKLGDPQSSWWHWRRGAASCLAGWLEVRRLQLMLCHAMEVGICWLKVPLTCHAPVWVCCNFQGMARASSLFCWHRPASQETHRFPKKDWTPLGLKVAQSLSQTTEVPETRLLTAF